MASTLKQIRRRLATELGYGWNSTAQSGTATTLVDIALKDTDMDTDWFQGAYLYRPDAASANDLVRRVSSFADTTGTFTHVGRDYTNVPVNNEEYEILGLMRPIAGPSEVPASWNQCINDGLAKCLYEVRDEFTVGSGTQSGRQRFSLAAITNLTHFNDIRYPELRRTIGGSETTSSATLAEILDTTETGVDVSDGTQFSAGDVIEIDSERMHITAIATNTLTVTRGYEGTTAAAHSSGASIGVFEYEYTNCDGPQRWWKLIETDALTYELLLEPAPGVTETVVIHYLRGYPALSAETSSTVCPLDLAWRAAASELFHRLTGRDENYQTQFRHWHREFMQMFSTQRRYTMVSGG